MKYFYWLTLLILTGCTSREPGNPPPDDTLRFGTYSEFVQDSFHISVYVPQSTSGSRYPVVYILDANFYFDIYATIMKHYSGVGLLPECILVGIGYKDFPAMDSLRQRDYTYPKGLPEYEMAVSGGGEKFRRFIDDELIPVINKKYPADTARNMIMGHSLGGYYVLYSIINDIKEGTGKFEGYIAASPSLHFNNYYLLNQFDSIPSTISRPEKIFISFGEKENAKDSADVSMSIKTMYNRLTSPVSKSKNIKLKTATYSELDHMDTQITTFIKGVQWVLSK